MTADEVQCPWCGARPGEQCRTWFPRRMREPHVDRLFELAAVMEREWDASPLVSHSTA
jgi:hypothetical protein